MRRQPETRPGHPELSPWMEGGGVTTQTTVVAVV